MPKLTLAEIEELMDRYWPDARRWARIESVVDRELVMRMPFRQDLVRAGGTIAGPAMMALADTAAYYLTLAHVGARPEMATANLDIHFLARPKPIDILATAHLLRLGRRLAVSTVAMRSDGSDEIVAHATVTYALPP